MPKHLECLEFSEEGARTVSHVVGDLLLHLDVPLDVTVTDTQPFGVRLGLLLGDTDLTAHLGLTAETVARGNLKGRTHEHVDILPGEEPVELHASGKPSASFHHEIGGFLPSLLIGRKLSELDLIGGNGGITTVVFEEERPLLTGRLVDRSERMPPPVVSLFAEFPGEHTLVAFVVHFIEHIIASELQMLPIMIAIVGSVSGFLPARPS